MRKRISLETAILDAGEREKGEVPVHGVVGKKEEIRKRQIPWGMRPFADVE